MQKEEVSDKLKLLQDSICHSLEELDQIGKFKQDLWERPGGGGGRTRIITGQHIEKGGVNYSAVSGKMPEKILKGLGIAECQFYATGVSIVLHPRNPHVPIIHMNVRYFETDTGLWWFGGGIDLTPHFVVDSEAEFFHSKLKNICDKHNSVYYPEFKKWADDYFYVKHRKETRGIGGIFFDRLDKSRTTQEEGLAYILEVGNGFVPIYQDLFKNNFEKPFTEREKEWQLHRRGRYVEFNLVWDRGTKFGLETDGNIESILMSLPPMSKWTYRYPMDSKEANTISKLKKGTNWISYKAKQLPNL